jgi:hypothetical protein
MSRSLPGAPAALLVAVAVVFAAPGVGGAVAGTAAADRAGVAGGGAPAADTGVGAAPSPTTGLLRGSRAVLAAGRDRPGVGSTASLADGPVIAERQTFARGDRPGTVRLTLGYDVPTGVTAFRVRLPDLAGSSVSLVSAEGFDRESESALSWTRSTDEPTLTVRLRVSTDEVSTDDWGVERDGWAFATVPPTGFDVTYAGTRPAFSATTAVEGPGYATDRMAFMGRYEAVDVNVSAGGGSDDAETVRFVLGNGTAASNLSAARSFLDRAEGRFDFGVRRDRLVVFVLPYEGATPERGETTVTGEAFGDAFWVTADATTVSGAENAFAHEYVHSRLTDVGNGSAAWLTEATAEYYGALATLNVGGTSYGAFRRATTAERFAPNRTPVTLSEPSTWRGTLGDYEKGAHVLAALDAEIRARTDGTRTLYDVFRENRSFDDHAAFRAAVVETAGDESLGPWLDRYVTTDALPPVPDDPGRYVLGGDLDPDGDGIESAAELSGSPPTNPFAADTDGDSLDDGRERETGTDPTLADTDGDGTNDALDAYPTDPAVQRRTATETAASATATGRVGTTADATGPVGTTAGEGSTPTAGVGSGDRVAAPGFGVVTGVVAALVGAAALAGMRRRRRNRGP